MATNRPEYYDVFLSHNSKDKPVVRELAQALKAAGVTVWLDEESLIPGDPSQLGMEQAIKTCRAAAVLVGQSGIGPWEDMEMRACITQFVEKKRRVIPILLPGASKKPRLPLFLRGFTWVDMRQGITDKIIAHLLSGIRATPKNKQTNAPEKTVKAAPQAVHNLPERNRHFSGRVKVLQDVEAALNANNGLVGITQVQGISGLGGIGKTQTALEYAWRHLGNPYTHLFWVRADSEGECFSGFTEIARKLELPERDDQDARVVVVAVLRWFTSNKQWLLILDNVEPDGQEIVHPFLPHGAPGHVLITSRAHTLDTLEVSTPIPLDKMTPREARDFLAERTGKQEDAIDDVAKLLDYLPLALEQAAAYIIEKACTFAVYAKSYEKHRTEFLNYKTKNSHYPDSVATTWRMNFEQIEAESKPARDLLYLSAFLDPDRIPLEILRDGAGVLGPELASALAECNEDPLALNNVLLPLVRYSLIRRNEEEESFSIHRLVQEVLRTDIAEEDQRTWAERAALAINAAFPGDFDFKEWPRCDRLLPHAQRAAAHIERYQFQFGVMSRLLNQTAYYLHDRARYGEAEPLYRRAWVIAEAAFGPDHPKVATVLNNLASLFQITNRLSEAESLYRRAWAIDEAAYAPDHPEVAIRINNLAQLLQATNRLSEAEPLMRRALAIDEAAYGPDHPNVAIKLNNLAQLLQATNRLSEAEPLMCRAWAIDEAAYGSEHPNVARDLNNLASLLQATNRLSEAEPLMRCALAIDEAAYGPDHPNVAIDLNNRVKLLQATNRLSEAEPLMRRAWAIDEAVYGPDHPDVARDLINLAVLLQATKRLPEAEPLMRRAIAIFERALAENDPKVATALNSWASCLQHMNRLPEAELAIRRALAIDEAVNGLDHPDVARDLNNLAALLQATNRLSEAEPLIRRALAIDEAAYGPDHPEVAIYLNNLAILLQTANRLSEAEPLTRRALEIFRKFAENTGHRHPHMLVVARNYFGLLMAMDVSVESALEKVMEVSGLSLEQLKEAFGV